MPPPPLFRTEAVEAQHSHALGPILLAQPLSHKVYAALAVLACLGLVLVLALGTYTRRTTVQGVLTPDTGLIRVTAPQAGVVTARPVVEGQPVRAGDLLYTLSGERQNRTGGLEAQIGEQLRLRTQLLKDEEGKLQSLLEEESRAMARRVASLKQELLRLQEEMGLQTRRLQLAAAAESRYARMATKDLVSRDQHDQKVAERLDQASRLAQLERGRLSVRRDLEARESDLAALQLRYANQLSQLQREQTGAAQDLSAAESRLETRVVAPVDGTVTALLVDTGQRVEPGRLLVHVVPASSRLVAQLHAPSRSAGFVRPGTTVRMRLHAFPYQRFGQAQGEVLSVSRTTVAAADMAASGLPANNQEACYLVTVALTTPLFQGRHKDLLLQPGMQLDADLMSEQRRLYEWALAPLRSLSRTAG